jgi:hypothetical protein
MGRCVSILIMVLLAACTSTPREGSGSPFESGSLEASVQGSNDIAVSQVIRDASGSFRGTLTYSGSCPLMRAELRFAYERGGTTLTAQEIDGVDEHMELGPMAPNQSDSNSYSGESKFTPDAIVFVISNERCA